MKTALKELKPEEFDEHLLPIFNHMLSEADPGWFTLNLSYFMSEWKNWMRIGIARAWEVPGAVAGAVFTKDLYSGVRRASLMFWFSLPKARRAGRTITLLNEFERAGKEFGATKLSAAAHCFVSPDTLAKVYRRRGYAVSELIFSKDC